MNQFERKFESAESAKADRVCTACTYCQIQFDAVAKKENLAREFPEPQVYTDLLAESFGMS